MKKLLLIRHAKSSWDDINQKDFERPLNDRGHKDAPMMAKRLLKAGITPDALVSSPALRALTTAEYFAEVFDIRKKNVLHEPSLYLAAPEVFFNIISALDNDHKTVAIFSHNPGITEFVNQLGVTRIDDMPTCSIFGVKADIKHWRDFKDAEKKFWFFDFPKNSL